MTFSFRPALRENVGLLIGLAGGTGSGKTFSAMRLAAGIAGDRPFCVIDTEAGRAKHYADAFTFDHGDLAPPFTPERYAEAIAAADKAGYPVIVVDSMSLVWSGDGGVLDMQEEEFARMGHREAAKMASWIKPKMAHKQMVQKLLQVRAHLILCFRAEEKVDMIKVDGKMKIVPKESPTGLHGWMPISEKNLPYELTASFLLTADAPGIPKPIKLQQQHRELFPLNEPITEKSGRYLAAWASGGTKAAAQVPETARTGVDAPPASTDPPAAAAPTEALQQYLDGDIDVDAETGEIVTKPTARSYKFALPGLDDALSFPSTDDWFAEWTKWCEAIAASTKISPSAKEAKIRALKSANDEHIKAIGGMMSARIRGDMATRLKALKEEAGP